MNQNFLFASRSQAMHYIGKGFDVVDSNPYQASLQFKKAIAVAPKWDYPYILLADIYDKNYLLKEGIATYEKAIHLGISQPGLKFKIYHQLGLLYVKNGQLDKAEKYLKMVKHGKVDSELVSLEQLREAMKARDDAVAIYEEVEELRKKAKKPSQKEAVSIAQKEAEPVVKNAIELLNKVVLVQDDWIYAVASLGDLYRITKQNKEAKEVYLQAMNVLPFKDLVLSGNAPGTERGGYYFVRDTDNSGKWSLTMTLPKGTYFYCFYQNFKLNDEKKHLDLKNKKTVELATGDRFNKKIIKENNSKYRFIFYDFPRNDIFLDVDKELNRLMKREKYSDFLYGEKAWGKKIDFSYLDPNAYSVWIVGEFNDWGLEKDKKGIVVLNPKNCWKMLSDSNGNWKLIARISPGVYEYNYLINKSIKAKDPFINPNSISDVPNISDLLWKENSILDIGEYYNIEFTHKIANVKSVWVAGEFNEWGGEAKGKKIVAESSLVMKGPDKDGIWRATIRLKKGRYRYKFYVNTDNGFRWHTDNKAKSFKIKGRAADSVVYVGLQEFKKGEYFGIDKENGKTVKFTYIPPENKKIKSISVVGDFNEWGGKLSFSDYIKGYYYPMKKNKNSDWIVRVKLPPGRYQYKFLINGKKRLNDKNAKHFDKKFKKKISVVVVSPKKGGK